MKIRKESKEVFFIDGDLVSLNKKLISNLILKCEKSYHKKSRYCFHREVKSKVQEMIICHKKGYYVRPHKHLDKEESIFVIKGKAKAVFFNNSGNIKHIIDLGDLKSKKCFYYKLNSKYFHTLIIQSKYFIFHEVSEGPFRKNMTKFASWSPDKKNLIFNRNLNKKIKVYEKNF